MRVWLVHAGEPLPCDSETVRLLRIGLVAELLEERGHEVLWWSTAFDHNHKVVRPSGEGRVPVRPGYALYLLRGIDYPSNISIRRWINHWQLGRRFAHLAPHQQRPDIVLCAIPTLELASAGVAVAREWGVPCVVDVQDIWPDAIAGTFPAGLRRIARWLLAPLYRHAKAALRGATGIVAVSPSYLRWGLRLAGRAAGPNDQVFPNSYPRLTADADAVAAARKEMQKLGVDPGKKIAWYIGYFGRSYDLSTVIRAAKRLKDDGQFQFVLSGAGDDEDRYRREAAGLPNVVFTGWVTTPGISYLMSVAWAGLAAYARDAPQSLPYKLSEYMSAGLPVLSSLQGDGETLLSRHDCGVTYRAGDDAALASGIEALGKDPGRRNAMSRNAREAYERYYHADKVYRGMVSYLEGLAGSGALPPLSPGSA